MAPTRKIVNLVFAVVLVVTLFAGATPPVLADQYSNEGSFSAYVFKDGEWQLQGILHFSNYETLQMQLSNNTGQLKLRLVQEGHDAAYIDQVIVRKYGIPYLPASAVNIDNNTDVLTKILYPEYDVCNGWDSTLEIVWDNAPENAILVMRAMEQDLGEGHGSPMYYPWPFKHRTLSHLLVNDVGITVDGLLQEPREPDFSVFWQPYSPHPAGYTYGWIYCDNEFLYAAVEVTADNTPDAEDWGALYIIVDGKQKEFRISEDQTWGVRKFQYTSSVPYEHRIYEFKIPLSAINAVVGSEIQYIFGAYGTVVVQQPLSIETATGTGIATFATSGGAIKGLTAATSTPCGTLLGFSFPHGFFSFSITLIAPGSTVTIAITLPYNIPRNTQYWKCQNGQWVNVTSLLGDNDGDNVLTLTLTDGGLGDADGVANGTIVDPGGPGLAVGATTPRASPSPPQLPPADVQLHKISVSPGQAQAGQPVTVLANVVNNGASAGSYNVALNINGKVEQQRTVEVSPGTAYPVKFTVTKSEPGTYDVAIDGQRTSFIVVGSDASGAPVDGSLIALIAMAVLILATAVVLAMSFRRTA